MSQTFSSAEPSLAHAAKTVAGLDEDLQPDLKHLVVLNDQSNYDRTPEQVFLQTRLSPLPPALQNQVKQNLADRCVMGLFPSINRAWLTVDEKIFLWDYTDKSRDFSVYDGLERIIVSAGLVTPKPGVFVDQIKHLLVLATPLEINILGVSFYDNNAPSTTGTASAPRNARSAHAGELHLQHTQLAVASDNVEMRCIQGTSDGRIFMGGADGCLYELAYQSEDGWFSRRCRKINHSSSYLNMLIPFRKAAHDPIIQMTYDASRSHLFTLSENGTISLYSTNSASLTRLDAISNWSEWLRRTSIDAAMFRITSITAVTHSESKTIVLVAVSSMGLRIYFELNGSKFQNCMYSLPPDTPLDTIDKAFYKRGIFVLVDKTQLAGMQHASDKIIGLNVNASASSYSTDIALESFSLVSIQGKAHAVAEIPAELPLAPEVYSHVRNSMNELASQHLLPARRFVLLTSKGLTIISKLRPVDQLQMLLLEAGDRDSESLDGFFRQFTTEQTLAMCLILACSDAHDPLSSRGDQSSVTAAAFGGFGNSALVNSSRVNGSQSTSSAAFSSRLAGARAPDQMVVQLATWRFFHAGGAPSLVQGMDGSTRVMFSSMHTALYLYFARLVRGVWKTPLLAMTQDPSTGGDVFHSQISSEVLFFVRSELYRFRSFLERHLREVVGGNAAADMRFGSQASSASQRLQDLYRHRTADEAVLQEKSSLVSLHTLISRTIEILSLVDILVHHDLEALAETLDSNDRARISRLWFSELVASGEGDVLLRTLISQLMNQFTSDTQTVEAISTLLREQSPSMFGVDDTVRFRAHDQLRRARQAMKDSPEQRHLLADAARMFQEVIDKVDSKTELPSITKEFHEEQYYDGLVDVALAKANSLDPQAYALEYHRAGHPEDDDRGREAYDERYNCYRCILHTLDALQQQLVSSNAAAHSETLLPAPVTMWDSEDARSLLAHALASRDELFHLAVYDWFEASGLARDLLEMRTPFIEGYLKDRLLPELLWRYYSKNENYGPAAKILAQLAESKESELTLDMRCQYLSLAISNAKSAAPRAGSAIDGELLHDLEEKREVADIQLLVRDELYHRADPEELQQALQQLNSELMDVTKLYNNFASVFQLDESCLALFHCSAHYDPPLVESIWSRLLNDHLQSELPAGRLDAVCNVVTKLGALYYPSENVFPLPFLINQLEVLNCQVSQLPQYSLVIRCFLSAGVPFGILFDEYNNLYKSQERFWHEHHLHLISVVYALLAMWKEYAYSGSVSIAERKNFSLTLQDAVSQYSVELDRIGAGKNRQLYDQFRSLLN